MNRLQTDTRHILMPTTVSLTLFVVLTILGTVLGFVVRGDRLMPGDIAILEAIQDVDLPGLGALVSLSNLVFSTGGALLLAAIVIGLALYLQRAWFAVQMILVVMLRLLGQVLKPIFDSPRPGIEYQPDPSIVPDSLGYPSGHAYTATILACMLAVLALGLDIPRWARWSIPVGAVVCATFALFSRVYVGAHWPSDTIGGVLFGVATFALMQLIVQLALARGTSPAQEPHSRPSVG